MEYDINHMNLTQAVKEVNDARSDIQLDNLPCKHDYRKKADDDKIVKCAICALAIRHNAIKSSCGDSIEKAKWQRLWLRHCMSSETNFIFSILKEVKDGEKTVIAIDREAEVSAIVDRSLTPSEGLLRQFLSTREAADSYRRTILKWFLQRYNRKRADEIYKTMENKRKGEKLFNKISLYYPRLLGAIVVGIVPLISVADIFGLPRKIPTMSHYIFCLILLMAACCAYLIIECNNITDKPGTAVRRAFGVFIRGMIYSFIVMLLLTFVMNINYKNFHYDPSDSVFQHVNSDLINILFFTPGALLLGIFIEIFWGEKTITEPL